MAENTTAAQVSATASNGRTTEAQHDAPLESRNSMVAVEESKDSILIGARSWSEANEYTHSKPARGPRRIYLQDRQAPLSEFNLHRCSCDTPGLEQRRATSRAVVGELPIHLRAYDKAVYMTESLESLNAKESASRMDANTTRPMRQLQLTSARPYTFQCY
ncbi:hypothetical protein Q7P35_007663 [Cladosporium inversicolor]